MNIIQKRISIRAVTRIILSKIEGIVCAISIHLK